MTSRPVLRWLLSVAWPEDVLLIVVRCDEAIVGIHEDPPNEHIGRRAPEPPNRKTSLPDSDDDHRRVHAREIPNEICRLDLVNILGGCFLVSHPQDWHHFREVLPSVPLPSPHSRGIDLHSDRGS